MLKIVGDINFSDGFFDSGFGVGSRIKKGLNPFEYINRSSEDMWIGNCECVIANSSNKKDIYRKQFRIGPQHLSNVHHLNVYNVANNHVMQHGEKAYREMINYFDSNQIITIGRIERPIHIFVHQNKSVGIMAFSQRKERWSQNPLYWYNPEYKDIEVAYKNIATVDYRIAYVHWGNEFIQYPYSDQKKFAHWLVDLGFDLIIGTHPHVLQGYEKYKGSQIFYSLGNFVFNMPTISSQISTIISVDLSANPIKISNEYVRIYAGYLPRIVKENGIPVEYSFITLNRLLANNEENEVYYEMVFKAIKEYRRKNMRAFLKNINRFEFNDFKEIIMDFFRRRL